MMERLHDCIIKKGDIFLAVQLLFVIGHSAVTLLTNALIDLGPPCDFTRWICLVACLHTCACEVNVNPM